MFNKENFSIMKKNMGITDKVIRIIVALVIAVLFYMNIISGTLGVVLLILAGVFVLTSFISFCPLYTIFGLSTCPTKKTE
jgi:glucan phosphoethanolaminetransferase (alkaline phosphatase superfamily)